MAMAYNGFSVDEMLLVVQKQSLDINFFMLDNKGNWRITVKRKNGEVFNQRGTFFSVVKAAFEPYLEQAKQSVKHC